MMPGMTFELLVPAFTTFVFGLFFCSRFFSLPIAMAISGIKIGIPLLYFSFFINEKWMLIDGLTYFSSGQLLLSYDYAPLSIFNIDAITFSMAIGGGQHVLYDWYNLTAIWLFGPLYAAPVFLNVGLTFGISYFVYEIAIMYKFQKIYCKWLLIFFLLHWELLSWFSFNNLKDALVLYLTLALFYSLIKLMNTKKMWYALPAIYLCFLFFLIRFYIPLLLILSLFIYFLIFSNKGAKRLAVMFSMVLLFAYVSIMGWQSVSAGFSRLNLGFDMLFGAMKIFIMPRPWALDEEYSFLLLASLIHWLLFFPMLYGMILLWMSTPIFRLFSIYLVVIFLFYGAFEELLGSRQRIQVLFIYGWAQYHFLWVTLRRSVFNHDGYQHQVVSSARRQAHVHVDARAQARWR